MSSSIEATTPNAEDFKCPIGLTFMFEPFKTECGHHFERSALSHWVEEMKKSSSESPTCPCCRGNIGQATPASIEYVESMFTAYDIEEKWDEVHFDFDEFAKLVTANQLETEIGKRYIRLLSSSTIHLSSKATDGEYKDKTAFEVLARTVQGRNTLREKLKIMPQEQRDEQYAFGKSKITSELLNINVDGHSIKEHLTNWSLIKSDFEEQEQNSRARLIQFYQDELPKLPSDIVNEIMQDIVYGQRDTVKEKLDKLKQTNPALLEAVLTAKSTIPTTAYSGWTIAPNTTTLLQAALKCGDIAIHENYQGAVEIISSYFDANGSLAQKRTAQLNEVFPNGLEAHINQHENDAFKFKDVIDAINNASKEELEDIVKNSENTRAQWSFAETNTGKPLIDAMNRFRAQFKAKSLSETIPSLHHLREAYKTYDAQYDEWRGDDDTKWLKRDLMARQVIGFVQRFLSAHEAQVSAHGLYLVAERKESPTSSFKYNYGDGAVYPLVGGFSGLGFDNFVSMVGSGRLESWCVGWGWAYDAVGKIMSSKNNKLGELIPKPSVPAAETGCQCVIQ